MVSRLPQPLLLDPGSCNYPLSLTSGAAGTCSIAPAATEELDKEQFFKRAAQRSPGEDPHAVFAKVDKDKSGGLSRDEMREYYKSTAQAGKDLLKNRQAGNKNSWADKGAGSRELSFAVCTM